jgi:hypothetical protein
MKGKYHNFLLESNAQHDSYWCTFHEGEFLLSQPRQLITSFPPAYLGSVPWCRLCGGWSATGGWYNTPTWGCSTKGPGLTPLLQLMSLNDIFNMRQVL